MIKKLTALIGVCCFISASVGAQTLKSYSSAEIYNAMQQFNFLGKVLYVAAHPDDENTRLISWLANELHAETAYLSITRGDGGQNLIGTEIREGLGLIRLHELLAARSIDGGKQFFTRANDFGYSKTPEETLSIWNKEAVLQDVVQLFRSFKPDVIINRFDHRTSGTTHGHHTASALLSIEAFEKASNPAVYPELAKIYGTWQPSRMFFNTSWFFYGSQENFEKADKSNFVQLEVGSYFPLKGFSNAEISALSRSQHKSQGFGSSGSRGQQTEYIEFIKGTKPADPTDLFEGINTTWTRVKGGNTIAELTEKVLATYDFKRPEASLSTLLEIRKQLINLNDDYWKQQKLPLLDTIILQCLGIYTHAVTSEHQVAVGETFDVNIEITHRSTSSVVLKNILVNQEKLISESQQLSHNQQYTKKITLSENLKETADTPFWLAKPYQEGMYAIEPILRNRAALIPAYVCTINFEIDGQLISKDIPVQYRYTDPVLGEQFQPFYTVPPASIRLEKSTYMTSQAEVFEVEFSIKSYKDNQTLSLTIEPVSGVEISPKQLELDFANKGETKKVRFKVNPNNRQDDFMLKPMVKIGNKNWQQEVQEIRYEHIPWLQWAKPAQAKVLITDIKPIRKKVLYIAGAGDLVPEALEQMGYEVVLTDFQSLTQEDLRKVEVTV
ncbi:MAG: PIG-L family deacetylase, partial [Flavobacteriaceae bacterium]|nr:PIG-L family deacetylase [Flavobacteriaceae bacterium]